jgi:hypothetical protein
MLVRLRLSATIKSVPEWSTEMLVDMRETLARVRPCAQIIGRARTIATWHMLPSQWEKTTLISCPRAVVW